MTLQPGKQTIAIHILPNISRSKGNRTIKFVQLIEFDTRKTCLEKLFTKCGGKTLLGSFSKKSKLSNLSINNLKIYTVCFNYIPS